MKVFCQCKSGDTDFLTKRPSFMLNGEAIREVNSHFTVELHCEAVIDA